jgi:hypothetical protein
MESGQLKMRRLLRFVPLMFLLANTWLGGGCDRPRWEGPGHEGGGRAEETAARDRTRAVMSSIGKAGKPEEKSTATSGQETEPSAMARALVEKLMGRFQVDEQGPGDSAIIVDLSFTTAADADLERLSGLIHPQQLYLIDTRITDAGLVHLRGQSSLEVLDLARTRITDQGLAHLAGLNSLQTLGLSGTRITDAGVDSLRGLKQLKKLDISSTSLTDAGSRNLRAALPAITIVR